MVSVFCDLFKLFLTKHKFLKRIFFLRIPSSAFKVMNKGRGGWDKRAVTTVGGLVGSPFTLF